MSEKVRPTHYLQRLAPPLTLGLLAPLVAEYLLGDLRITEWAAFPGLALMYGGGAVLIREVVQRTGRGWAAFLVLAVAYAILEEGVVDQSLFNPDFMHQHLLAYGFWPMLGTAPPWAICVITLHVVWSLAVPVGMTDSLFPEQSGVPWLGRGGLTVTALLFLLGTVAIASFFHRSAAYHASTGELTVCAAMILGLVVTACSLRRPRPLIDQTINPPVRVAPGWLGGIGVVAGSLFVVLYGMGAFVLHWPGIVTALVEAGVDLLILLLFWISRPRSWTPVQVWAATTGGLLVYAWHGYQVDRALHGSSGSVGHTFIVVALCTIQATAWFCVTRLRAG